MLNDNTLVTLNNSVDHDFFTMFNRVYHDAEVDDNPYIGLTLSSKYYDIHSLSNDASLVGKSVYISINIQSLLSKYDNLLSEISEIKN
jgi:hypothetical protein